MTDANDLTQQIIAMKEVLQLQLQLHQAQTTTQHNGSGPSALANPSPTRIKQVKVPDGRYEMNRGELRTFIKDCRDYKKLTKYSDAEIILQLRLHMDQTLKRAIDINHGSQWYDMNLDDALNA